jgi:hypothetical protein
MKKPMRQLSFPFGLYDIGCAVDPHGQVWWNADEVRAALASHQGLHQTMSQNVYSLTEMLAIASDLSPRIDAMVILAGIGACMVACQQDSPAFWQLYACVAEHLVWEDYPLVGQQREIYLYAIFRTHLSTLIPGALILDRPGQIREGLRPDFLIQIHDDVCPVEIKADTFNQAAVRQLRGYITAYDAPRGYAVAPKLTGRLDANMLFVPLRELDHSPLDSLS